MNNVLISSRGCYLKLDPYTLSKNPLLHYQYDWIVSHVFDQKRSCHTVLAIDKAQSSYNHNRCRTKSDFKSI